jgi:hypothetical protein
MKNKNILEKNPLTPSEKVGIKIILSPLFQRGLGGFS